MRVRCVREYPSEEQIAHLGPNFYRNQSFPITVGKEYLVLGIETYNNSVAYGTCVGIQYKTDDGNLLSTPIILFEITDPRVSNYWEARITDDGGLLLWPTAFYREYYHDDLSSGVPEVMKDFNYVYDLLDKEYNEGAEQLEG